VAGFYARKGRRDEDGERLGGRSKVMAMRKCRGENGLGREG